MNIKKNQNICRWKNPDPGLGMAETVEALNN